MFGTTVLKFAGFAFVVLASASGIAGVDKTTATHPKNLEIPVALDSNSLLVATLANGEIETHWMARDDCERVASVVESGGYVAGVRPDGVRMTITQANCSTRRIEVNSGPVVLNSSQIRD
ncbi:hypothetical protein [Hyphomicrobium sp.]|jgi:hypothetical protein|uniref:hypothetical protein n=1 Tax=Hyphomicrobium sp. TaxID=82 RepID=UPI003563A53D